MKEKDFLRADFHTHPLGDRYYPYPPKELTPVDKENIRQFLCDMAQRGLDILACTDHDTVISGLWARELAAREGIPMVIIPGAEVSVLGSTERMHLLALNIKTSLPARRLPVREAVKEIHRQGGVAILAHPVKYPQEINNDPDLLLDLDGIETVNVSEGVFPADRFLDHMSCYQNKFILQTTGSDFHWEAQGRSGERVGQNHPYFRVPVQWLLEKGVVSRDELANLAAPACGLPLNK